ncbi:unnamed protein product [Leptosia nina]|uniref:MADF domain-containing protein n=1 Tax=Leptosia nina TaxID=320188 RepID=A0AAV1JRJ8_9NEOP
MADTNLPLFPRDLLKRFILLYKESRCLWDRQCQAYKRKKARQEAVSRLTKLVREYDATVTRVHVLRKIESIRSCVRREYRKVQSSKWKAKSPSEIYTPTLWYYNLLSFAFEDSNDCKMKTEVEQEDPPSEDEPETIDDTYDHNVETYMNYVPNAVEEVTPSPPPKRIEDDKKRHCTEVDDEYDAIGINVAAKLRSLPPNMRIRAEKLINDVLFQAQTNTLTATTYLCTSDPIKTDMII